MRPDSDTPNLPATDVEIRTAVADLTARGWSQFGIADVLGVSPAQIESIIHRSPYGYYEKG